VPVNWALFRLIGRVEWAWVAAPIVALACTATVIRMARLDIGFARSMTEIALVELHRDYPRAHVSRYTALYTSLTTGYRFHADDPGTQTLPFPTSNELADSRFGITELVCRYGAGVDLDGLTVSSNSTALTHTEQMLDLGGPVALLHTRDGRQRLVNQTKYTLRDVGIIRKIKDAQNQEPWLETAWLGTLEAGGAAVVELAPRPASAKGRLFPEMARGPSRGEASNDRAPDLSPLVDVAADPLGMPPGEIRLIGWCDEEVPGLDVRPAAPQARHYNVVVAHLHYAPFPDPQPDRNTRADVDSELLKSIAR
jgi:hypothetical protein